MKKWVSLLCITLLVQYSYSQSDSTKATADTIKVGGMIIIKTNKGVEKNKDGEKGKDGNGGIVINKKPKIKKNENVSTNWWIVDLGFSNYKDNTNYSSTAAQALAPGSNSNWNKIRAGKSRNVNVWMFQQKTNLIKHVVNLKYGLGVELNNYHFSDKTIKFNENPTLITRDATWSSLRKNKLALDYATVPIMLNFNFNPKGNQGFGFSAGLSAGYLYSARQKTKMNNGDKHKTHDDFDFEKWKISYVGELSLGPVRLYGSYAMKSMYAKGFDITPYTVGLRVNSINF